MERVSGRKRIGMFDKFMGKERHGDLKKRAEDRHEWKVWLSGTCLAAES